MNKRTAAIPGKNLIVGIAIREKGWPSMEVFGWRPLKALLDAEPEVLENFNTLEARSKRRGDTVRVLKKQTEDLSLLFQAQRKAKGSELVNAIEDLAYTLSADMYSFEDKFYGDGMLYGPIRLKDFINALIEKVKLEMESEGVVREWEDDLVSWLNSTNTIFKVLNQYDPTGFYLVIDVDITPMKFKFKEDKLVSSFKMELVLENPIDTAGYGENPDFVQRFGANYIRVIADKISSHMTSRSLRVHPMYSRSRFWSFTRDGFEMYFDVWVLI